MTNKLYNSTVFQKEEMDQEIEIMVADERHLGYVTTILDTIEAAAKVRGTGKRSATPST